MRFSDICRLIHEVGTRVVLKKVVENAKIIYGIPLLRDRVAPRCTIADSILLLEVSTDRIVHRKSLKIGEKSWNDLLRIFSDNKVGTLVCGGIDYGSRRLTMEQGLSIIDNVACSDKEVMKAIETGTLIPGLGLSRSADLNVPSRRESPSSTHAPGVLTVDCLACQDRSCLEGKTCFLSSGLSRQGESKEIRQILNSAFDISLEDERVLCRLSELVYFALEMNYKTIGVAYCIDLLEEARIVVQVLRRFFTVLPICCKVGGKHISESPSGDANKISCNPAAQALILNAAGVDFNIVIGLCIGTDSIFSKLSSAPASTLFVKDKSLANNPIAAVYLDHFLKEVTEASVNY